MIRNLIAATIVATLSVATVSIFGAAHADEGNRLDAIIKSGTLRVGSTGDYKPFTYKDPATGAFSGIDIDMAENLGKALGVKVEFVQTAWGNLMKDFEADKYDVAMGGISVTLDRAKRAFFTIPMLREGKTPITKCENVAKFGTLAEIDRPDVKVVVNPGGTNERFARANAAKASITVFPDNTKIFDEIAAGARRRDDDGFLRNPLPAEAAPRRALRGPPREAVRLRRKGLPAAARREREAVRRPMAPPADGDRRARRRAEEVARLTG